MFISWLLANMLWWLYALVSGCAGMLKSPPLGAIPWSGTHSNHTLASEFERAIIGLLDEWQMETLQPLDSPDNRECDFLFFKICFSVVLWRLHDLHGFQDVFNLCRFINCTFSSKCSIYLSCWLIFSPCFSKTLGWCLTAYYYRK